MSFGLVCFFQQAKSLVGCWCVLRPAWGLSARIHSLVLGLTAGVSVPAAKADGRSVLLWLPLELLHWFHVVLCVWVLGVYAYVRVAIAVVGLFVLSRLRFGSTWFFWGVLYVFSTRGPFRAGRLLLPQVKASTVGG